MLFSGIPRIKLLEEATHLQHLSSVGSYLGNDNIYIKRDDLMPLGMGGNKLRCLEFWLGDAVNKKSDIILVAGNSKSNQCRLTAAAAAKIGMRCIILHNSDKPEVYNGNILLNKIMNTETIFLGEISEEERRKHVARYADELREKGHNPYIINEDPAIGALGYVNSALELIWQAESKNIDLKHIFICGSEGMTEAGLLYGLSLFGKSFKLHIVSVEYQLPHLRGSITNIYERICKNLNYTPSIKIEDVAIFYDEYLGDGYEKATSQGLNAIKLLAQREAIFIENTYNSKVFGAMFDLVKRGIISPKDAVCSYNTGGTPALFVQNELFV